MARFPHPSHALVTPCSPYSGSFRARIHLQARATAGARARTHTHTHSHTHTHTNTHARTQAHTHTDTDTHRHTDTHASVPKSRAIVRPTVSVVLRARGWFDIKYRGSDCGVRRPRQATSPHQIVKFTHKGKRHTHTQKHTDTQTHTQTHTERHTHIPSLPLAAAG